ncbi:MAG: GNAT family N-acetyltransferase [Dehalococcoidia bacterium]|nr:GNAT family N-acetyltransferase [Dehalococcoidia bacterium]
MTDLSPTGARYRPACMDDAPALALMRWDSRVEERPDLAETADREAFLGACERWIRHRLALGTWTVWLAEVDREPVSHAFVNLVEKVPQPGRVNDRWGYVTNVYTRPAWRNQGVGGTLVEWVKAWALGADLEFLILWPSEDSREFYARAGFGPVEWAVDLELRPYEG